MVLFQHGTPDTIVQMCYSLVCSDPESFNEPGTVRLQPVLHDDWSLFLDTLYFDILYRLGVDHQRDRQTERQTDTQPNRRAYKTAVNNSAL